MKTRQKIAAIAAVIGVLVVALVSLKIYFVRDDSGGDLLWNSNEAYLFMSVSRRGYKVGYWEYPWMLLKEWLYGGRRLDDQRTSVTVVHITASGVEHHVVEMSDEEPANTPDFYTRREGYIYANYHGSLCKWTGSKFETATEEEERRLDGTNRLNEKNMEKGWSERGFADASSDYQFTVDVGQTFKLEVTNKQMDPAGHSTVSIDVARPGQAPEGIWRFDGRPRRVSKTEYEHAFARQ